MASSQATLNLVSLMRGILQNVFAAIRHSDDSCNTAWLEYHLAAACHMCFPSRGALQVVRGSLYLQVADVGGGTGFCTLGIVQSIPAENVTLVDQSPHQLAKAKQKAPLQGVTIMEVTSASADVGAPSMMFSLARFA